VTLTNSKPLKIAMVAACPFPLSRGTPVRILRMSEAIANAGHDVHVITYHIGEGTPPESITVHRIPPIHSYNRLQPGPSYQKLLQVDFKLAVTLVKAIREQAFDIMHAHHYEGLLVALLANRTFKIPLVYDAHTLLETELYHYSLGLPKRFKRHIGKKFDHLLPVKADHIISVSDEIRSQLININGIQEKNVSLVPGGIELDHFNIPQASALDFSGNLKLGFAGNFAEYQGIENMLRSFKIVLESRPNTSLQIISNSPFNKYEDLAVSLGIRDSICLLPSEYEFLPQSLADADILLNPRFEGAGYPLKLLNYMAAGKPIVTFSGSARGIEHGKNGWVIPGNDPQDFADGILHLLSNPEKAHNLGINARKFVEKEFSWKNTAIKITSIYQNVIEEKSTNKL